VGVEKLYHAALAASGIKAEAAKTMPHAPIRKGEEDGLLRNGVKNEVMAYLLDYVGE